MVGLDPLLQDMRPRGHTAADQDGAGCPEEQRRRVRAQDREEVLHPAAMSALLGEVCVCTERNG